MAATANACDVRQAHAGPSREHIPAHKAFFGIKSGYVPSSETLGLKVAGFWPPPEGSPIPGHFAVIFLLDGESGTPLAFMDGNLITTLRTGAAGAVAAKYLARSESNTVGAIGAGVQGRIQVRALAELFELSEFVSGTKAVTL